MGNICENYIHIKRIDDDGEYEILFSELYQVFNMLQGEEGIWRLDYFINKSMITCETKWNPTIIVAKLCEISKKLPYTFELHYFESSISYCGIIVMDKNRIIYMDGMRGYKGILGG